MSFHRFKIFPLKNNTFNIINVICSSCSLKRRGDTFLEQFPAPKCGKLLAEWQNLVATLKRHIYTSLVKYQILKKRRKDPRQPLAAFLGGVHGRQGKDPMLLLFRMSPGSTENRGWAAGGQTRLCGRCVLHFTLSFRISFPLHFWQGHVQ